MQVDQSGVHWLPLFWNDEQSQIVRKFNFLELAPAGEMPQDVGVGTDCQINLSRVELVFSIVGQVFLKSFGQSCGVTGKQGIGRSQQHLWAAASAAFDAAP